MNLTIAEASMARPGSTGDHTVFDELARLADTLDDERIVFEVEIRIVMEWVVCAGDLLRGMCEAPSHTFNPVNGSEYETEPSCRMRDTKNKRSVWQNEVYTDTDEWEQLHTIESRVPSQLKKVVVHQTSSVVSGERVFGLWERAKTVWAEEGKRANMKEMTEMTATSRGTDFGAWAVSSLLWESA